MECPRVQPAIARDRGVKMSDEAEVMMPVTKPDALQHIEITVLRQIGDNIAAQTRRLETLSDKVDDVRERVIRIEASKTEKQVEKLETKISGEINDRLTALEAMDNRVSGVAAFGAWMAQSAPWLLAAVLAIMAFVKH
jgi:hypothetical protein